MGRDYKNIVEPSDELNALVKGVAHEINNPLAAIRGNVRNIELFLEKMKPLLEDYAAEKPDLKVGQFELGEALIRLDRCMQGIKTSLARVEGMVDDFDSFAGIGNIKTTVLDLAEVVTEAYNMNESLVDSFGSLELIIEAEEPIHIEGNKLQLEQAINNLIKNAYQAIEDKSNQDESFIGRVVVTVEDVIRDGQEWVKVIVFDNGPGVPEELREKIFMPFISTKPQGRGRGIGLPHVRGIAIEHGGRLYLVDDSDEGATFILELPRAS